MIAERTRGRRQDPVVQEVLRVALYQLFWLDRIPDHAAVNDAVQLCRDAGLSRQGGFVNAVLRGCLRERAQVQSALEALRISDPALAWSHPDWLVDRWRSAWGGEMTQRLLQWDNLPAPVWVRVNTLRTSPGALVDRWKGEGVESRGVDFPWAPAGLVFELGAHPPLATLPSFTEGGFYVQDPSTLLSVRDLDPQPGECVLDACAAPGGKATFIAQQMENAGRIVAHDAVASRLELIRQNRDRLGIRNLEITAELPFAEARFDRILVDAPCSNTGVLRRRVESRWRLDAAELPRLADRQFEILRDAAARLKEGGTLVYSTCSLEREENQDVVERFLAGAPEFRLEGDRQLHPVQDGVDGAYSARLKRR
jgi:16S rRNA (cytosine967-C5)-methyltransferase